MSDYENEIYSDEEQNFDDIPKNLNWKRSIYDDDEFENEISDIKCDYETIIKSRRSKAIRGNLSSLQHMEKLEEKRAENVAKAPPKTWNVMKVETSSVGLDFPTISDVKLTPLPSTRKSNEDPEVKSHIPKKWKKITQSIFQEETLQTEIEDVQKHSPKIEEPKRFVSRNPHHGGTHENISRREKPVYEKAQNEATNFKNTKLCNFGEACKKRGKGCNYAHTMDEFTPVECRFQTNCKNRQACGFKHADETKESFLLRTKRN
jgi:hypothetical protein